MNPVSFDDQDVEGDVLLEYLDEDAPLHLLVESYTYEGRPRWRVTWNDTGPNEWSETYLAPDVALARAALLVRSIETRQVFTNPDYVFTLDWRNFTDKQLQV